MAGSVITTGWVVYPSMPMEVRNVRWTYIAIGMCKVEEHTLALQDRETAYFLVG